MALNYLLRKPSPSEWIKSNLILLTKSNRLPWTHLRNNWGFPKVAEGKESTYNAGSTGGGFNPWVRKIPWRRIWQPTLRCLHEKSYGQKSLAGYSPKGCKGDRHDWVTEHEPEEATTTWNCWHRKAGEKKNILPKQEQKKQESWWGSGGVRRYRQALRFTVTVVWWGYFMQQGREGLSKGEIRVETYKVRR